MRDRLSYVTGVVIGALAVGIIWVLVAERHARRVDVLTQVKNSSILRVGVKADAPPFGVQDDYGRYGFDIDIANAVARELGVGKVEFTTVTSADRLDKVVAGEVDMSIASMTITRGREEKVDFTVPYFQDGQSLLVKAGSEIRSYEDLAGSAVGGARGSTSVLNIRQVQPDCTVKEYDGYKEAMAALAAGEVDAVTSDMLILMGLRLGAEDPGAFRLAGGRFSTEPYGIAVAENQSKLRDALNDAIQSLWEKGIWQRVYEDWFGEKAKYRTDVPFVIVPFPK